MAVGKNCGDTGAGRGGNRASSSLQLASRRMPNNGDSGDGASSEWQQAVGTNPVGVAVSPHSAVRAQLAAVTTNLVQAPVETIVPGTPAAGTEDLSTLATVQPPDLPSSLTINQFTAMHVFPKVKFYGKGNNDTLLDWSTTNNSICQFVLTGCNVPTNKRHNYWPIAAKLIHKKITILRNDRPICIRKAFFGKFLCVIENNNISISNFFLS